MTGSPQQSPAKARATRSAAGKKPESSASGNNTRPEQPSYLDLSRSQYDLSDEESQADPLGDSIGMSATLQTLTSDYATYKATMDQKLSQQDKDMKDIKGMLQQLMVAQRQGQAPPSSTPVATPGAPQPTIEESSTGQSPVTLEALVALLGRQSQTYHQKSPRIKDPEKLTDGTDPTFESWRLELENKLEGNHDHFNSEKSKMIHAF